MRAILFPGQGSQAKGMGKELFDEFKALTKEADLILGYSIQELCLEDPKNHLNNTRYTQPALYVVSALAWLKAKKNGMHDPNFFAGHSLGEYTALFAAGAMDFTTGLALVKRRGELMAETPTGGMAAIINMDATTVQKRINQGGFRGIEIANLNTPSQTVISGDLREIETAKAFFEQDAHVRYIILNVGGAFHSSFMKEACRKFKRILSRIRFRPSNIPVISNVTARPYSTNDPRHTLSQQMVRPVKWMDTLLFLLANGVKNFEEIGPGRVLTRMVQSIQNEIDFLKEISKDTTVIPNSPGSVFFEPVNPDTDGPDEINIESKTDTPKNTTYSITAESLGSKEFRNAYNTSFSYVVGGMSHGIASKEMVVKVGRAGMLGFLSTRAQSLEHIKKNIRYIQHHLPKKRAWGVNLSFSPREDTLVDLFLRLGVPLVEASSYIQMTRALVLYRLKGLTIKSDGSICAANHVLAKLSRPEVARLFLRPAPREIVENLFYQGQITQKQAILSERISMADDICVLAAPGTHPGAGAASVILPAIMKVRDDLSRKISCAQKVRIGLAGGIGTPEAAAAAFVMGADFILTGSINQCTVEAGTSNLVKEILSDMNIQDTEYAPVQHMFEAGDRIPCLKKGVLFPSRANRLLKLYKNYSRLEEIDNQMLMQTGNQFFGKSFERILNNPCFPIEAERVSQIKQNSKQKMNMACRQYLAQTAKIALEGNEENRANFQVRSSQALGAFNQWVKGSRLECWKNRHVDEIGLRLLTEAASLLEKYLSELTDACPVVRQ